MREDMADRRRKLLPARHHRRIAAVSPLPPEAFATAPSKRSEPRVPFLALVEAGLVRAGETVTDEKRRHKAVIRADGTLLLDNLRGEIRAQMATA